MGFCAVGLCNGLMSTYSKTFGLTFINDDHYFANVAIVQNVFNGACRIFWGFGYDRLGFKTCFLVIGSVVSIATALLPTLPFLGEFVSYSMDVQKRGGVNRIIYLCLSH